MPSSYSLSRSVIRIPIVDLIVISVLLTGCGAEPEKRSLESAGAEQQSVSPTSSSLATSLAPADLTGPTASPTRAPRDSAVSPEAAEVESTNSVDDFASPDADESENFDSFADLTRSADLVVLGPAVSVKPGPIEGSDEFPIATGRIVVSASRILRGDRDLSTLEEVEIAVVLGEPGDVPELEQRLRESLPDGDAIWVLRSIGDFYPGVFRLVTLGSVIEAAADGSAMPAWYRGTSERVRSQPGPGFEAIDDPVERLATELSEMTFDEAISIAENA